VSRHLKILRLLPFLTVVACAAPKATVVEEPKKKQVPGTALASLPPKMDEADQLRLPKDLLEKLPETNQFQATNPNLPKTGSNDGAVIAHPPSEAPH